MPMQARINGLAYISNFIPSFYCPRLARIKSASEPISAGSLNATTSSRQQAVKVSVTVKNP